MGALAFMAAVIARAVLMRALIALMTTVVRAVAALSVLIVAL